MKKRIIVAISGATGVVYGIRLLEILRETGDFEVHLILSEWACKNIEIESEKSVDYIKGLCDFYYDNNQLDACISSGSFLVLGMLIVPCSMKTLSAIANGYADSLISRCADVSLKEQRPLIIAPRETPLSTIHLENMLKLSKMGVCIIPPMPSFYNKPQTIDDIINHFCGRLLDKFGITNGYSRRWNGTV
ncbi:MAG: UbiX family flavin prenyltransferase [Synergistaceae bacterium]|jgi:4-hydroxy-3-polyprenylbenzoate decarboxylase|nr:UbiX family flavin prenyltransferase [Synergistaceae bacterium]